ncbi:FUSC family protein [Cellulosimicrobium cellulans]|uniref:FUSC family protein n=1 Tax=Cellulosimicrobium cellulans TaxID=1710 RepID=UPI0020CD0C9E|nr:hypothetical protein NMQ07_17665 [Cellulosimicrobium cellulans]
MERSDGTTAPGESPERKQSPARPRGSPMLIVLMIIVVLPSVLLADSWGAGAVGIIGGLTGLFSLVAFMGGPLRADLRVVAVLGPLLVVAAAVPRLLAETSRPAAVALVVVLGFVAALFPLLGERYATVGLGLGMTTVFGYGYAPQGGADHRQVVLAAVAGVVVAVLLRVVMGLPDPSKTTREQVAAVLDAADPTAATATAFRTWLGDGRKRWLAGVLDGASRYRLARHTARLTGDASPDDLAALERRAEDLAARVRARPRRAAGPAPSPAPDPASSTAVGPAGDAARALDAVEQALTRHDTSAVRLGRDPRHQFLDAVQHPSGRLRSVQVRHAFRTALALLVMLLVTSGLERGDPLVSTVLLTTFSIVQASWRDTVTKARNKILGLVSGSIGVAVVLLVVPQRYLTLVAVVALCLGLWFIAARPALGAAFMVVVSVGFNSVTRDLDPVALLAQYVGLTVCAVVVGVVLGFVVVPSFRPPPLRQRVETATAATAAALRAGAVGVGPAPRAEDVALVREAVYEQDELVPDREHLDDRQAEELDDLRAALRDVIVLANATQIDDDERAAVLRTLSPDGATPSDDGPTRGAPSAGDGPDAGEAPGAGASTLLDLARRAASAERYLLTTLPAPS